MQIWGRDEYGMGRAGTYIYTEGVGRTRAVDVDIKHSIKGAPRRAVLNDKSSGCVYIICVWKFMCLRWVLVQFCPNV